MILRSLYHSRQHSSHQKTAESQATNRNSTIPQPRVVARYNLSVDYKVMQDIPRPADAPELRTDHLIASGPDVGWVTGSDGEL